MRSMVKTTVAIILVAVPLAGLFAQPVPGGTADPFALLPREAEAEARRLQRRIADLMAEIDDAETECLARIAGLRRERSERYAERASAESGPGPAVAEPAADSGAETDGAQAATTVEELDREIGRLAAELAAGDCSPYVTGKRREAAAADDALGGLLREFRPSPESPQYGSFEAACREMLAAAGVDSSRIRSLKDAADAIAEEMQDADAAAEAVLLLRGELSGESGPMPTDIGSLRPLLRREIASWYLAVLAGPDRAGVVRELLKAESAFSLVSPRLGERLRSEADELASEGARAAELLVLLPRLGDAPDLLLAVGGEAVPRERWTDAVKLLAAPGGPVANEIHARGRWSAFELARIYDLLRLVPERLGWELALAAGFPRGTIDSALFRMERAVRTYGVSIPLERLRGALRDERLRFAERPEGMRIRREFEQVRAEALKKLERLETLFGGENAADPQELKWAVLEVQGDRITRSLLLSEERNRSLAGHVGAYLDRIYAETDRMVIDRLERTPLFAGTEEAADPVFRSRAAGAVADEPYRPERLVSFFAELHRPDGTVAIADIPRELLEPLYARAFWEATYDAGAEDMPDDVLLEWMERHDQTLTDSGDLPSESDGRSALDAFLAGKAAPPVVPIGDAAREITESVGRWMRKARETNETLLAYEYRLEAMRRAESRFRERVLPAIRKYGRRDLHSVPPHLQAVLELFGDVGAGNLSPYEAEHLLGVVARETGFPVLTAEDAALEISAFLVELHERQGEAFRIFRRGAVERLLEMFARQEPVRAADRGVRLLNRSLASGDLPLRDFLQLRSRFLNQRLKTLPPEEIDAFRSWAARAVGEESISEIEETVIMRYLEDHAPPPAADKDEPAGDDTAMGRPS